jgi:hypothetical protein
MLIHPVRAALHLAVLLLCATAGCTGLRHPTAQEDESRAVVPPESWEAAVTFYLLDSARVEFFDGVRRRVATSREAMHSDSIFGRTPWYRIRARNRLSTTFQVRVDFPGAGTVQAAYPLTLERGGYYSVWVVKMSEGAARRIIGAREVRSYPLPPAAQREPGDSLWIFYGARGRECLDCPS